MTHCSMIGGAAGERNIIMGDEVRRSYLPVLSVKSREVLSRV